MKRLVDALEPHTRVFVSTLSTESALLRDDTATVGLSGGLFGMLGALAVTTWKYRRAPLVGPRLPMRSWIILVVANLG